MAEKINDGGPAFPLVGDEAYNRQFGMSLRDWFAGQFLAGTAADNTPLDVSAAADQTDIDAALVAHWSTVARSAYIAADAMLAAKAEEATR